VRLKVHEHQNHNFTNYDYFITIALIKTEQAQINGRISFFNSLKGLKRLKIYVVVGNRLEQLLFSRAEAPYMGYYRWRLIREKTRVMITAFEVQLPLELVA